MLFAIHAVDHASALDKRLSHYDAHKAFLSDTSPYGVKIVMSGPLTADDGQTRPLIVTPSKNFIMPIHSSSLASGRR
jgi:uncharacterized protein YciI